MLNNDWQRLISMAETALKIGQRIENKVCGYLTARGLQLKVRNYSCKLGEIDLIMQDQDASLVFVEVRFRKRSEFGSGAESVGFAKRKKIIRAAKCYLQQRGLHDKVACRFDVVEVAADNAYIKWIKDAFWVRY